MLWGTADGCGEGSATLAMVPSLLKYFWKNFLLCFRDAMRRAQRCSMRR